MIDFDRWREVKEIVQGALDRPAEERSRYLDEACGGDPELRREAEALLAVSSAHADFFDDFQVLPPSMQTANLTEGDQIGPYRIIRHLGKGGMGSVYLAEDREHGRYVALKTVPRRSERVLLREKRLLAKLQHPNIATLYDSGQTKDGFGYFVMEYVEGEPITVYCETHKLTVEERLRLFLPVCEAVSVAHRDLIVHRDIKPSNILIAKDGQTKLLDFGIAKLLSPEIPLGPESSSFTEPFASPEQLAGEHTTTATDIYSLGVLLCLLLTGRLPYPVKSYEDLPWAIRNMKPESPSQLVLKEGLGLDANALPASDAPANARRIARKLRGDLDAIVLRALQKDTDKRYTSAAELADDIRRFLSDKPVSARKDSGWYRAVKFWQRHKVAVPLATTLFLVLVSLSGGLLLQYKEATRQRDQATHNLERAEQTQSFLIDIFRASDPWKNPTEDLTARELLDNARKSLEGKFLDQPLLQADLTAALGQVYYRLGLLDIAVELQRKVLSFRQTTLGSEHEEVATTLNDLGVYLNDLGKYAEAKDHLTRALAIRERLLGQYHSDVSTTYNNLGTLAFRMGNLGEAETYLRKAMEIREHLTGDFREKNAATLNNLAVVLKNADRLRDAEEAARRCLQLRSELYPPFHPSVGLGTEILGQILEAQGRLEEAERLLRKALEIQVRSLGDQHTSVARALSNLAVLLTEMERFEEAERYHRQGLAIDRATLPQDHPDIASRLHNLAAVVRENGDLQEAERLLREALAIRKKTLGPSHLRTATTEASLATLLVDRGQLHEAEALARDANQIYADNLEPNHVLQGVGKRTLGKCLGAQGQYEAAELLLLDSYTILLERKGQASRDTRRSLQYLTELYDAWGRADKAASYRQLLAKANAAARFRSTSSSR